MSYLTYMDTGMRDLEQIQERDNDEEGITTRRIATLMLAALATVALVFAMGVLLGQSADAELPEQDDPLAALATLGERPVPPAEEAAADEMPQVDREALAFPEALESYDRRPEVEAAIAAATAELAHPDPLVEGSPAEPAPPPELPFAAAEPLPTSLPASTLAVPRAVDLARSRELDPLVRQALPEEPPRRPAPRGMEGLYTLQVSSYPNQVDANSFCDELRARGHEAYVIAADIPDRGRWWRVRVGPFDTLREVESYRDTFEAEEDMNTFVVRRRD